MYCLASLPEQYYQLILNIKVNIAIELPAAITSVIVSLHAISCRMQASPVILPRLLVLTIPSCDCQSESLMIATRRDCLQISIPLIMPLLYRQRKIRNVLYVVMASNGEAGEPENFWFDPSKLPEIEIPTPSDPLGKYTKKTANNN